MKRRMMTGLYVLAAGVFPGMAEPLDEIPAGHSPAMQDEERWSSFLPFMREEVEARGHELPLPFGAGLSIITLKREIEVTEIKAGFGELRDVTDIVAVDATTYVNTIAARLDAWILPFLNVYVLGGYLENTSDVQATFTVRDPPPIGNTTNVTLDVEDDLSGTMWGGGITLAAGYGNFFLSLDGNYIVSELDSLLDETIQVALYSVRTGWHGEVNNIPARFWVGGMYWDSERTIEGSVGDLNFEVLQGPVEPTNLLLGANMEITPAVSAFAEYSFNFDDLRMLAAGVVYRF